MQQMHFLSSVVRYVPRNLSPITRLSFPLSTFIAHRAPQKAPIMVNLSGQVCLVTGGSKGIGRGIALQLGKSGATVYVTGRTQSELDSCCAEMKEGGGNGIPVIVDHSNVCELNSLIAYAFLICLHFQPSEVEKLFERIAKEQNGKLDVVVNNAYAAVGFISENMGKPFWEMGPAAEGWDTVNNVGLRNHYVCTVNAAR